MTLESSLDDYQAAAAALEDGINLALEWGLSEFKLKKRGMWLDEGLKVVEKYRGFEWEWSFCNNWGILKVFLGKG